MPRKPSTKKKELREVLLQIKLTNTEKQLFTEAADRQGDDNLSTWIRRVARNAANAKY
jgi:hypothetical protein